MGQGTHYASIYMSLISSLPPLSSLLTMKWFLNLITEKSTKHRNAYATQIKLGNLHTWRKRETPSSSFYLHSQFSSIFWHSTSINIYISSFSGQEMLLNVKCKVKFVIKIPHKKISQLPASEAGGGEFLCCVCLWTMCPASCFQELCFKFSKEVNRGAPGWLAGWASDFGSGHDLTVCGFEPRVWLCADSSDPGTCFRFWVSLPLPPCALSLSLSQK